MKSTGISRKLDSLGRIVLPKELRRLQDMQENTEIEIYTEGDYIVLKKIESTCVFCGSTETLLKYKDKNICKACLSGIENKKINK